jgi:D-alanine-D-alanine ligase
VTELITVAFGGPSLEHDVSILTGLQAERYLRRSGATVQPLYWSRTGQWYLVPEATEARDYFDGAPAKSVEVELRLSKAPGCYRPKALGAAKVDLGVVVSCYHGGLGEGGGSQTIWEVLGVPATGGTTQAAALGLDKLAFGALLAQAGLPVLKRTLLTADADPASITGPVILKPRFGGSSIGIEVAADGESALALVSTSAHLRDGAVVEPYRPDLFDLNVAYRTYPEFETSAIERPSREKTSEIYSFDEKYVHTSGLAGAPREIPALIPEPLAEKVRGLAREVARLTGLPGLARVDFLTDGNDEVYVNEVNSIPGAMSLYLWPDHDPADLLRSLVAEASRPTRRAPTTGVNEGRALRAAGGIAGKLLPQR